MNKYSEVENEFMELAEKKIDVMAVLMKYLAYWKWFILSIVFFLVIAAIYIYFTLPTYQVVTSILFKDDMKGGTTDLNMEHNMGMVTRRNNVDNELEIMKKSLVGEEVVRQNNMYVTYIEMNPLFGLNKIIPNFPKRETAVLYGDQLPIRVMMPDDALNTLSRNIVFDLTAYPDGNYLFAGKFGGEKYQVKVSRNDSILKLPFGKLRFSPGKELPARERWIKISIRQPSVVSHGFMGSMDIKLTSRNSTVADVKMNTPNIELGKHFLEEYIEAYNEQGIRDQLELAEKTAKIIDNHLANLSNELSSVEDQAQEFRQSQGLTDIASQASLYNSQQANVSQRKMDMESQHGIVSSLLNFVGQKNSHIQLIPANSGIQSPVLNAQIGIYNNLVLERNKLARIASSSNQSMIDLNNQLESTFSSVVSGLQSEKSNLEIQLRDINNEYSRNNARIRAIPQQERAFSDIKRQQNIKEELFLYLLQKKEERYMNMTAVEPNSKQIGNIRAAGVVQPKNMLILLLFFAIGLVLPIIGIYIRDLLRYQVDSKEELAKISSIPLLGEIPNATQIQTVAVKEDNNDSFNEMLRLLRANLMFVIDSKDKKVINVLSSIGGEGKSFISLNLATSLALLDRKVLLIELDIRKPKLAKQLELDSKKGMTLYLSGYMDKQELVKPSGIHPNLSVITAGSIPPNPNELLAKPALDELINDLKSEYDFIIVDTAPVGMVSDGFLLNRIADVNLFITRAGVTPKNYVEDADRYFKDNRLKKMYFVLNSVNLNKLSYRYGTYSKYGYGYA